MTDLADKNDNGKRGRIALPGRPPGGIPMSVDKPLSDLERLFVREYLIDMNATGAARRAGYSARTASQQAWKVIRRPNVARAIAEALEEKPGVTRTRIVDELAKIAFANFGDYVTLDSHGHPIVDLSTLDHEEFRSISEVAVDQYMEGRGDDAMPVKKVKVKMYDKLSALEKLGKTLAMFRERVEHSGADGAPLNVIVKRYSEEPDDE